MINFLTFDTNGQHSALLGCSFTIAIESILNTKLLSQECLKNRLILSFKNIFILSFTNICTIQKYKIIKHVTVIYTQSLNFVA